ncbi:MAG: glycerol-3-phosphate 1-O-acyltransferase PlsY [Acidobacteriota bacterium]|nr:glycerol-3-phosphate 1-O-acyltransferase PlsY [Acidobacteriota bacterium]
MISIVVIVLLAYLVGSLSPSLLLGRLRGIDIREHGSGNPGLTNVIRVLGWKPGLVVAVADVGKGFLAVRLLPSIPLDPAPWSRQTVALAAGFAVVAGHIWPLYSRFRGGKGIATGAGVLLALAPAAWVVCVGVFVAVLGGTRYVSVASSAAAVVAPAAVLGVDLIRGRPPSWATIALFLSLAGMAIWAHRSNFRRLRKGTEPPLRFGA